MNYLLFKNRFAGIAALAFFSLVFCAQNTTASQLLRPKTIQPDRPGFAYGTHVVTPDTYYIETGYQFGFNEAVAYSTLPVLNLRFGLFHRAELFVGWDGPELWHKPSGLEWQLPFIGGKYRVYKSENFNLTAVTVMELSYEDEALYLDPSLALAFDTELFGSLDFFGMAQAVVLSQAGNNNFELRNALGLGYDLNKKVHVFAEYYHVGYPEHSVWFHGAEIGLLYLITSGIQLDIHGGFDFKGEMPSYVGVGFARRF